MSSSESKLSVKEIFLERLKKLAEQRDRQSASDESRLHKSEGSRRLDGGDRLKKRCKFSAHTARLAPNHAFEVNEDDHCETSGSAYDDISPLLRQVAEFLGKSPKDLVIYDPYFCNGAVIKNLAVRGFPQVYNKNEDFYRMIEECRIPEYDVLVTNPPFSGSHVERILKFCVDSGKPFFCLVPNYVYTKPFYSPLTAECRPFYVVPGLRYEFWTPRGFRGQASKEKKTSPFLSFWYCHGGKWTSDLIKWWRKQESGDSKIESRLIQNLRYLPQKMKATFDPNRRRLRKKQRIRLKLKASVSLV